MFPVHPPLPLFNWFSNFHPLFALPIIWSAPACAPVMPGGVFLLFSFGPHIISCYCLLLTCPHSLAVLDTVVLPQVMKQISFSRKTFLALFAKHCALLEVVEVAPFLLNHHWRVTRFLSQSDVSGLVSLLCALGNVKAWCHYIINMTVEYHIPKVHTSQISVTNSDSIKADWFTLLLVHYCPTLEHL